MAKVVAGISETLVRLERETGVNSRPARSRTNKTRKRGETGSSHFARHMAISPAPKLKVPLRCSASEQLVWLAFAR
jgi:hypothetical protein